MLLKKELAPDRGPDGSAIVWQESLLVWTDSGAHSAIYSVGTGRVPQRLDGRGVM